MSLLLSIIMVLQIIVPQVQVQAKSGETSVQMSEGQKIGERSEVFTFKNTKKPIKSWFTMGTMSLNNARQVSTTRTETLKIKTTATGLDNGKKTFDWAAFGQNRKFTSWIEVAYEEDKKTGEEVATERHKVSEDFEISSTGDINATVTLDSSKKVDYYYLRTEYDEGDKLIKVNAILDYKNSLSPKNQADLTFKIGIQQIVSTTITYNLIDEYGKAINLNDAKEEKPEDTDLENQAKFGNGTDEPLLTFNLKKDGTDILRDEQIDDEDELIDSSIKLILEKDSIKSNNIDYKLTSTYDVLDGGKVTIKRQKDVVTPKDPHNPGTTPEGYARLNLSADALGGKTNGTFTKDDPQDTQRVVDVKEGQPYTSAQAEVDKVTKPIPLTSENKEDTGKTFDKWTPALSTLGTAVAKDTKTLNATYKSSDKEIIPYLPTEPVPTKDKDGLPIPENYVTVIFKSENVNKGKVKIDDKEGVEVKAKVKPGIDLSTKAEITTIPEKDYGFTEWKPALTNAAEGQTYTAHFIKSGDEINEGDPIPKDWFKVKVSQDESIVDNTVVTKFYTVKPNGTLASDKFAKLDGKAKEGYKDPAWYVGSEKLEKPYERQITTYTEFLASATEEIANKFKNNPLKAVDITAYKGDTIDEKFWNKGVKTQREDAVLGRLIASATVTDTTDPARNTDKAGTFPGTLKVTFDDGSSLEVQNQRLIVIDTKVDIDYDKDSNKDANAPRHKDEVVKGKIKSDEILEGAKVEILDKENNVIGITLANTDGSFVAGTRPLEAGETIKVRVTLPKADKASDAVEKIVKLNPDRLNQLLPIAKAQKDSFSKKQNAIIKERLKALEDAITTADPLVDAKGKATATDTAENQTAIDNAVTALEEALKKLTANIPPSISGPKTHEIFVGEALDLKALVDVTDGDGADDLVVENGSNVKITAVKVEKATEPTGEDKETPVTDLSTIKDTVGTYKVTYTAEDKAGAKVTHVMTLTVKPRTTSAIEVTTDPSKMSYLITEKGGKAQLDLKGMTLNLVDNLGKKTKVELTDPKVKFKVNGKEIKNGGDLTLADDVQFIEVEYTPEGSQTPLTAKTDGVLRVGPDYDKNGADDRTQNFDPEKIEKLEVIKQPQLDYIAKDKSEADKVFKLNLEGMIVRMTDKAGKEKLAVVKNGKFVDYDDNNTEITVLTATPAHGAKLTPETSANETGDNGKTVKITGPNNSEAITEPLKVFYDANKDGTPDHKDGQKTPAPSAMARNVGENPTVTTVEGMATPGAVIKITDKDGAVLTTEPTEVKADASGHYKATLSPMLADGTDIKVTAKLGEMGESDPTPAKVFDDKNDNKQPDRDEGFNIEKATDIKFVDQPDLTYLVKTKETEVTFDGKDAKGKAIYLELSYKNGEKTESKIMTLEDLMKDTEHIAVTPAKGTTDKKENQTHELVGKAIEVKLKNVVEKQGATEDQKTAATATSTSKFAIEIDADGNGKADKEEKTPMPSILSARNIKEGNDVKTKVLVKGEPGATITIKSEDGKTELGTGTVGTNGEVEIKLNSKQEAGTKIQAIAKLGEKKPSDPAESIVFDDLDNDGKPDGQGSVDFKNIVDMRIASDPKTMSYAVKSDTATTDLKLDGLTVYVKDKNGNTGIYQYGAEANKVNGVQFEELKGNTNFKLELVDAKGENPAAITDQTKLKKANDANKVKVTLMNGQTATDKADTTGPLNVFVDANGNGVDDDKEKLDLTKVTSIKVISQPELNYPITLADNGKKNLDLTKMVVAVSDGVTTANFTAKELLETKIGEGQEAKAAFKLELVQPGATAQEADVVKATITELTGTELTTANDQNKVKVALASNTDVNDKTEALEVFEDLDGDGNRDTKQTPAPTDLKALNVKDDAFTTITGKAQKGDTLKVYGEDKKEIPVDKSNISIDENGNFTIKVSKENKALPKESLVFVTAQADKKDESPRTPVVVKVDADGSGTADSDETTTITSVIARNIGTGDPKQKATFTTIEGVAEKGSKVTITFENNGQKVTKTVEANANTGEYKLELNSPAILLPAETKVEAKAKYGEKKDSPTIDTKVFDDLDADGQDDNKAGKTERPAAIASNIGKNPTFTTITGEAEKSATVTAKVGTEVVGTATADAETGKYTIQAKQNNAPIKEGVKIDVTATLAPKDESLKQTVVVFKDTDGDGQPDSSKDFDVKKATGMQVVASPDKMVYTDGDQLNLDGLRVLIKDVYGNQKIFTYNSKDNKEFTDAGLSVNYKQNDMLSNNDNGKKLTVTLDTKDNKEVDKAITGETPTALTVNKMQSAKPTDLAAANQGDAKVTKVKGKAVSGAEIKVTDKNGNNLLPDNTTVKADSNGDFTADLNKLLDPGTKVYFTATEPGKTESPKEEETVIRDKDGNWKADTGSKLSTPVIDSIREKDEKVVVEAPKAEDKIKTIEVSDQNGNTVKLTKDDTGNTWTVVGSDPTVKVREEAGKIAIPVKDKLPLNDRDQIKVTFKDGETPANEAFDKVVVQKASQKPTVDPIYTNDTDVKIVDPTLADPTAKTIKVKVNKNDTMTIEKQDDGTWKNINKPNDEVKVEGGKVIVPLDPSAKKDDVIKVSTVNDSKVESPQEEVKVVDKVPTQKPTIENANKDENFVTGTAAPNAEITITVTPKNGEPKTFTGKADASGKYKVTTDPLVDGDKVVAKASEPGKADNTSDPTTVGVKTGELQKSIEKAEEIGGENGKDLDEKKPIDKELKDALEKGKEVKEKGDAGDPNTDQDAVDKAKKELDKAIAQKEADTAVDKAKDDPSTGNINDAQDKIDAIPGSTDPNAEDYNPIKKELQDKLDLIKKIKEGEDRLKQDDVTGENDTPKKPQEDIDKLKKAIQDGKDALNNNEKGKFGEKTTEIENSINILNQERINVSFKAVSFGSKTLFLRTSVPGARITVSINGKIITKSKVRNKEGELVDVDYVTADPFGTYTLYFGNINEDGHDFTEGLSENDEIIVEATKDGYNPGEYTEIIY